MVRIGLAVGTLLTLSACMGGSSTSSFTSFRNTDSSETTVISGRSVEAPFTGNLRIGTPDVGAAGAETGALLRVERENDEVVGVRLTVDGQTIVDEGSANGISVDDGLVSAGSGGNAVVFRDPEDAGFEYQTYGLWVESGGLTSTGGQLGVLTVGSTTDAGNVPSGTTATYRGESVGWAQLPTGEVGITAGAVTLQTGDFSRIDFATENTVFAEFDSGSIALPEEDLDLTGTLTVNGSSFSGSVSGAITDGTLNGRFYGPNAEEAGGLFVTTGSGGVVYNGSFGARR